MIVHVIATVLTAGVFLVVALLIAVVAVFLFKALRVLLWPDLAKRHQDAKRKAGFVADREGAVTEL